MSERIRITHEELRHPDVTEAIQAQEGFAFGAPGSEGVETPLIFKPWFALMIAGMVGAILAWGLIEPIFDDGIRFRGVIRSTTPLFLDEFGQTHIVEFQNVRVFVHPETDLIDANGNRAGYELLRSGQTLEILLEETPFPTDYGQTYAATFVKVLPATQSAKPDTDLSSAAAKSWFGGFLLFPLTAGLIGALVGAADGLLSRAWTRAIKTCLVSFAVGLILGSIATIPSGILFFVGQSVAFGAQSDFSADLSGWALTIHIMVRGIAWSIVGFTAGIGQGIALKSRKLFVNGAIGGAVGALVGGVLFDPINLALDDVVHTGGAELSRLVGLVIIGAGVGLMIGVVELVTRESWMKVMTGPIAGKEFVLYRDPTWIGSSPKCEIYLFKDEQVDPRHAAIHRVGEHYEIEDQGTSSGTKLRGRAVQRTRLANGDKISIGRTVLEFRVRDD